ncbi:MAG: hypothetical protein M1834_001204 [Cirrosporium novae-zelandiae]|nr:MAG: hypothetical protein M1834_001204 [Cirrosporium novae-zelandiae]
MSVSTSSEDSSPEAEDDFSWLSNDRIVSEDYFKPLDWDRSPNAIDFGADGYTGSVTDWHKLLQITAPHPKYGIVYVRGDFSDNAGAILARSKTRIEMGGSWGVHLRAGPDLRLGGCFAQGLINYRWPYMNYEIVENSDQTAKNSLGNYDVCSFVKDHTVFQLVRLQLYAPGNDDENKKYEVRFQFGGPIRFGHSRHEQIRYDHLNRPCSLTSAQDGKGRSYRCSKYDDVRLEVRLFVNGVLQDSTRVNSEREKPGQIDISAEYLQQLSKGNRLIIMVAFSLRTDLKVGSKSNFLVSAPSSRDVEEYLGVTDKSYSTGKLWSTLENKNADSNLDVELSAIARCVERIMGVSSVPIHMTDPLLSLHEHTEKSNEKLTGKGVLDSTTDEDATSHPSSGPILLEPSADTKESADNSEVTTNYMEQTTITDATSPKLTNGDHERDQSLHNQSKADETAMAASMDIDEAISDLGTALITNIMTSQFVDFQSTFWQIRFLVKVYRYVKESRPSPQLGNSSGSSIDQSTIDTQEEYLKRIKLCIRSALVWLTCIDDELIKGRSSLPLSSISLYTNRGRNENTTGIPFRTISIWYVMEYCSDAIDNHFWDILQVKLYPFGHSKFLEMGARPEADRSKSTLDKLQHAFYWRYHFHCAREIHEKINLGNSNAKAGDCDSISKIESQEKTWKLASEKYLRFLRKEQDKNAEKYVTEDEEADRLALLSHELKFADGPYISQTFKRLKSRKPTTIFSPGSSKKESLKSDLVRAPWELTCLNHHTRLMAAFVTNEESEMISSKKQDCFQFLQSDYSFVSSWDWSTEEALKGWWGIEASSIVCSTLLDLISKATLPAPVESVSQPQTSSHRGPEEDNMMEMLQKAIRRMPQPDDPKNIEWIEFKPPRAYYPTFMVQSLDDTPQNFQTEQLQKVNLRSQIKKYVRTNKERNGKDNSSSTETILDFSTETIAKCVPPNQLLFMSVFDITVDLNRKPYTIKINELSEPSNENELEVKHQNKLLDRLKDSLIDLNIKHRILFAQRFSPSMAQAFIYVWHPDALDTFDEYFGSRSRFTDTKPESDSSIWTTSITISHWGFKSKDFPEELSEQFSEQRDTGPYPPEKLPGPSSKSSSLKGSNDKTSTKSTENSTQKDDEQEKGTQLEKRSSSIVFTGDPLGHFWTCSMVSSIIDKRHMDKYVLEVQDVSRLFIYRQASGRLLSFLILLGHFCHKLAEDYTVLVNDLEDRVGLSSRLIFEGMEVSNSEGGLRDLHRIVWGFEALRVWYGTLVQSISVIDKVQDTANQTFKEERSRMHYELNTKYEQVIDEFKKRFKDLSRVESDMQQKIDQISQYRDSITAITNVQQSIVSLQESHIATAQGENIRILTLITIVYLPLGFVAGLFSVNDGILPNQPSLGLFIGLIFVFVVITYGLAFSLGKWIKMRDKSQEGGDSKAFQEKWQESRAFKFIQDKWHNIKKARRSNSQKPKSRKARNSIDVEDWGTPTQV